MRGASTTAIAPVDEGFTVYVPCPVPYFSGSRSRAPESSGDLLGLWVRPGEEVEWHWVNGRVTGYTIHPAPGAEGSRAT